MESMAQVDTIRDSDVHERSELLPKVRAERKRSPLPKVQFGVLMLGQLAEPVSATCILPFLNQMISEFDITGKDPAKVGYYVGLMVSLFFLTEAMTVLHWSRLSDRIGRKPVLCIGLAGITVSMLFVGLSRSFWVLVLSRMLCGALNGNTGVAKSATGELTDSTNVAQAFALMPITWAAGVTVAPLMGGLLQRPAERFPQYFDTPFWRVYPYFLPCLAAAIFSFVCLVVTFFLFEETLAKHNSEEDDSQSATPTSSGMSTPTEPVGNMILQNTVGGNPLGAASLLQGEPALYPHPTSSIATDKLSRKNAPLPLRQLLASPGVAVSIANYGLLAILDIAYGALLPLFLASPVLLGGLGLDPPKIGVVMGTWGLLNGLFQAMCFTRVLGRLGPRRTFVMGISCFVPIFAFFGIENAAARIIKFSDHAGVPGAWIVWTLIAVQMMLVMVMDFSFGTIFIYIRAASPSKRSLGATNGLAQLLASIVRAIGPACATSMYAFSVDHDLLGGYAVYVVLIAVTTISLKLALALPREIAEDD